MIKVHQKTLKIDTINNGRDYIPVYFNSIIQTFKQEIRIEALKSFGEKGTLALLFQRVKIIYKGKNPNRLEDKGFEKIVDHVYMRTYRVSYIIRNQKVTYQELNQVLNRNPQANIYRIISNHPINEELIRSIQDRKSVNHVIDVISEESALDQILKFEEGEETRYLLDKYGKPQYVRYFLDMSGKARDIDLRNSIPGDYTVPESLRELLYS